MVDENSDHEEMSNRQEMNREDAEDRSELERALALLKPAASSIDRDRFLFLAGRASVDSVRLGGPLGQWTWPAATLFSSLAAGVLALLLVTRPQPAVAPVSGLTAQTAPVTASPNVAMREPSSPSKSVADDSARAGDQELALALPSRDEAARELASGSNYPRLRSFVLAYGVDALPDPAPIRGNAPDAPRNDPPRTQRELLRAFFNGSTHSAG